jgi:GR25 family glycosyltransferase involved in LPS biosynthesis
VKYLIISLENNRTASSRRLRLDSHIQSANLTFEYIWAYYGKNIDRQLYIQRDEFRGEQGNKRSKPTIGNLLDGEFGLVLTTVDKVFNEVQNEPADGLTVIFEDDVVFSADLDAQLREVFKKIPQDFDLAYLGYYLDVFCNANANVISPKTSASDRAKLGYGANLCPQDRMINIIDSDWLKLTGYCTAGGWAYVIRNSSLDKIQNEIKKMRPLDQPIDEIYRLLYEKESVRAYGLKNQIVDLNYGIPSTIQD